MKQRILTAILAGAIFLTLIFIGHTPFILAVYALATIGLYELLKMKNISIFTSQGIISVLFLWVLLFPSTFPHLTKIDVTLIVVLLLLTMTVLTKNKLTFDDVGFIFLATMYIGFGFYYLIETRSAGLSYLFFALFVIWATDSGAYFVGKSIGKRKLWPLISPNKTIEGSLGGTLIAMVTAFIYQLIIPIHESMLVVLFVALIASLVGQIGDLVESAFKRHYIVKDSGHILPGHGGILDRFDSLLFVLPLLHFIGFI